jgi:hypothetical protein
MIDEPHLAQMPVGRIASEYGYTWAQAQRMKQRARSVQSMGLTGAIHHWTDHRRSPDFWFGG